MEGVDPATTILLFLFRISYNVVELFIVKYLFFYILSLPMFST